MYTALHICILIHICSFDSVYAVGAAYMRSPNDSLMSFVIGIGLITSL